MLRRNVYQFITGNKIRPMGWLKRQLIIQAEGLSGNLDKVWPDISQSRWIGGDREGWERVPYWLDGFIPLAWLLEDKDLQARARQYINAILEHQNEDGWICPCSVEERKSYDMWALFLIAKVLTVYADLSGDERVEPALYRAFKQFDSHIDRNTLFNWSAARWFECLIPLFWLYERIPEPWLIKLAHKLHIQGIDYKKIFDPYLDTLPVKKWTFLTHVVNLAMSLKQEAVFGRLSGSHPDAFALEALDTLLKYHGMPIEHFSGDECVAGRSPTQGTELCSIVEAMYSYEVLLCAGGNVKWADLLEKLAFNALPATVTPDMWAHQYVQQTNQVQCAPLEKEHTVFMTNGPESHVFGLEPNFGCCTANFNQGFPKFAQHTFLLSDHGIVSAVLAPSRLETCIHNARVICQLDTEYPFRDRLTYTIETDRPVTFELLIRIPGFAHQACVDGVSVPVNGMHSIHREWTGKNEIIVELSFQTEMKMQPGRMASLSRGPLLYALPIDERCETIEYERNGIERKHPYCDYYKYPLSDWGYGFTNHYFQVHEKDMGVYPFSPEGAAITVSAQMTPLSWEMEHGICASVPSSLEPIGPTRSIELIPYGCTNLRMTQMPLLGESGQ